MANVKWIFPVGPYRDLLCEVSRLTTSGLCWVPECERSTDACQELYCAGLLETCTAVDNLPAFRTTRRAEWFLDYAASPDRKGGPVYVVSDGAA